MSNGVDSVVSSNQNFVYPQHLSEPCRFPILPIMRLFVDCLAVHDRKLKCELSVKRNVTERDERESFHLNVMTEIIIKETFSTSSAHNCLPRLLASSNFIQIELN